MKRCPQCEFIYTDSDNVCDFDQTPLIAISESEIAALTNTPERPSASDLAARDLKNFARRRYRRTLPLAAALGLILSIVAVAVYLTIHKRMTKQSPPVARANVTQLPETSSSPPQLISNSPSPEAIGPEEEKPIRPITKPPTAPSTRLSPISTGPPRTEAASGRKPVILLTSGGKIEADAVWRTRDGIWYRRDGVVTLLKGNRVRAISSQ